MVDALGEDAHRFTVGQRAGIAWLPPLIRCANRPLTSERAQPMTNVLTKRSNRGISGCGTPASGSTL
jgi:hypothetical protein